MADALTVASYAVSTTEVVVAAATAGRDMVAIKNTGNYPVYLGPTGVTPADGYRLDTGDEFKLDALSQASAVVRAIYAISGGSTSVCVIEDNTA